MKYSIAFFASLFFCSSLAQSQSIDFSNDWKLKIGDSLAWAYPKYNDKHWKNISKAMIWESAGYDNYDGFGWYRKKLTIPSSMKAAAEKHGYLLMQLGLVDDADETYFNGKLIGATGMFPPNYLSKYNEFRVYKIDKNLILWDTENLIAVRVYDSYGGGGFTKGQQKIIAPSADMFQKSEKGIEGFPLQEDEVAYQKKITFPDSLKKSSELFNGLNLNFDFPGEIELFLNSKLIGNSKAAGKHKLFVPNKDIQWGKVNTITVYAKSTIATEGFLISTLSPSKAGWKNAVNISSDKDGLIQLESNKPVEIVLNMDYRASQTLSGTLVVDLVSDIYNVEDSQKQEISIKPGSHGKYIFKITPKFSGPFKIYYRFIEKESKEVISRSICYGQIPPSN